MPTLTFFRKYKIHRDILTFTWKGVKHRFRCAPFGLTHLPGQFQRLTNCVHLLKKLDSNTKGRNYSYFTSIYIFIFKNIIILVFFLLFHIL